MEPNHLFDRKLLDQEKNHLRACVQETRLEETPDRTSYMKDGANTFQPRNYRRYKLKKKPLPQSPALKKTFDEKPRARLVVSRATLTTDKIIWKTIKPRNLRLSHLILWDPFVSNYIRLHDQSHFLSSQASFVQNAEWIFKKHRPNFTGPYICRGPWIFCVVLGTSFGPVAAHHLFHWVLKYWGLTRFPVHHASLLTFEKSGTFEKCEVWYSSFNLWIMTC